MWLNGWRQGTPSYKWGWRLGQAVRGLVKGRVRYKGKWFGQGSKKVYNKITRYRRRERGENLPASHRRPFHSITWPKPFRQKKMCLNYIWGFTFLKTHLKVALQLGLQDRRNHQQIYNRDIHAAECGLYHFRLQVWMACLNAQLHENCPINSNQDKREWAGL